MRTPELPAMIPAQAAGPLLVGYSGGLDSSVLLHVLAADPGARDRGLRAVHVHHGLHADADAWERHCRAACAALDVPLTVRRVRVRRDRGLGPEAAARQARHAAFGDLLETGGVLVLAHHLDDQAETFLLRALRASGDGLAAMRPWRRHGRGWLWRPFLATPRSALRAWALARGLRWIEDPGNAGTDPDRNFLRHQILPHLRARWPRAAAGFARSAELVAQSQALLAAGDAAALAGVRDGDDPAVLRVDALLSLPRARRARVLRLWVDGLGLPALPAAGVDRIERDLLPAAHDAEPRFDWARARVQRWRGLLHAGPARPPLPPGFETGWDGVAPLALPGGDRLALESDRPALRFAAPLRVHARRGGERVRLPGREHRHALKRVLQELGVPRWQRERLPLLSAADGTVVAAGELVLSAGFDAWLRAHRARLRWTRDGGNRAPPPPRL